MQLFFLESKRRNDGKGEENGAVVKDKLSTMNIMRGLDEQVWEVSISVLPTKSGIQFEMKFPHFRQK